MAVPTPQTIFSRDVLGNYVCNTFAEARASGPFDAIIIGGGTFGLALAENLFFRARRFGAGAYPGDGIKPTNYRILVLEAGPFVLPAHTQDIPNLRLFAPNPTRSADSPVLPATRQQLIAEGRDRQAALENWGLPWNSAEAFGGLAYCIGGRSLYWGGWSPEYLTSEMHTVPIGQVTVRTLWPGNVIADLRTRFYQEAVEQTGVSTSNDFINGRLHDHYRQQLFAIYAGVPDAVPVNEYPDYTAYFALYAGPRLQAQLAVPPYPGFVQSLRLDAPLAVQTETRPGFFALNKLGSVPLAIAAAREAVVESGVGNDAMKRLMIVPNCHVTRLTLRPYTLATGVNVQEIVGIDTSDGQLDLSPPIAGNTNRRPIVILTLGAIESARMALLSAGGVQNANEMGRNLMVHVRKNAAFTAPLPAGLALARPEVSALFLRCRRVINGTPVHFHFQITASAVPPGTGNRADMLLFRKIPDLEDVRRLGETAPGQVDVVIRAIGEMLPNVANNVTVPQQPADLDEYLLPRASVAIARGPEDAALQAAIDQATRHLAQNLFAHPNPAAIPIALDGLGTTFHESGTLRMGEDPTQSVVNADGQFHFVTNLYAGDAAVLPTCGSANPVINGIALQRRLAKRVFPEGDGVPAGRPPRPYFQPLVPAAPPAGAVINLFDGATLRNWRMAGRGTFHVIDGALQSVPSFDLGLLWCTIPMPADFRLELEFFIRLFETNAGVFVCFRNPDSRGYYNPAWSAADTGFEVQIDNSGSGQPPGLAKYRTGAVYNVNYPGDPVLSPGVPPSTPGDYVNPQNAVVLGWNQYRIDVQNNLITVTLNGVNTARYTNPDPNRGRPAPNDPVFVGLQSYSNYSYTAAFRNIRITVL
ncbi:MAG: hypothetical protein DMG02_26235 [Acidobacteria bacterium]|nr:MAG: hypothetical protein DMG02_26235 [Acidobacteriota bacterium]